MYFDGDQLFQIPQHKEKMPEGAIEPPRRLPRRPISSILRLCLVVVSAACLCGWLTVRSYSQKTDEIFGTHQQRHTPINLVLMISDGYGPASHTMVRSFYRALRDNNSIPAFGSTLPLDADLVGSHRSSSSDSLITDSAAGATAFSCGKKSFNGGIGVDADGVACGTIFEAAKAREYLTGVVATSRLTDATPASFFAHVASRSEESLIASQMLVRPYPGAERTIDLAIGGGGCYFLPKSNPLSCRKDDKDLVSIAKAAGWDVNLGPTMITQSANPQMSKTGPHGEQLIFAQATKETPELSFKSVEHRLPFLSLVTPFNTPYVIDNLHHASQSRRQQDLASLSQQAIRMLAGAARIGQLSKSCHHQRPKGFMLMVEGSQIDLCQHQNDPACMVREAVAYQEAAAAIKQEVDALNARGQPTLLISTSDHETGGLTLGRQLGSGYPKYEYHPERLIKAQASAQTLSCRLLDFLKGSYTDAELRNFISTSILGADGGLGLGGKSTGGDVTDEEIQRVLDCLDAVQSHLTFSIKGDACRTAIAEIASRRAQVGWSTPGHTGVDINVYAYGHGSAGLKGNIENTEVSLKTF